MAPISLSTYQEASAIDTPVDEERNPSRILYAWCTVAQKATEADLVDEERNPSRILYAWCTVA